MNLATRVLPSCLIQESLSERTLTLGRKPLLIEATLRQRIKAAKAGAKEYGSKGGEIGQATGAVAGGIAGASHGGLPGAAIGSAAGGGIGKASGAAAGGLYGAAKGFLTGKQPAGQAQSQTSAPQSQQTQAAQPATPSQPRTPAAANRFNPSSYHQASTTTGQQMSIMHGVKPTGNLHEYPPGSGVYHDQAGHRYAQPGHQVFSEPNNPSYHLGTQPPTNPPSGGGGGGGAGVLSALKKQRKTRSRAPVQSQQPQQPTQQPQPHQPQPSLPAQTQAPSAQTQQAAPQTTTSSSQPTQKAPVKVKQVPRVKVSAKSVGQKKTAQSQPQPQPQPEEPKTRQMSAKIPSPTEAPKKLPKQTPKETRIASDEELKRARLLLKKKAAEKKSVPSFSALDKAAKAHKQQKQQPTGSSAAVPSFGGKSAPIIPKSEPKPAPKSAPKGTRLGSEADLNRARLRLKRKNSSSGEAIPSFSTLSKAAKKHKQQKAKSPGGDIAVPSFGSQRGAPVIPKTNKKSKKEIAQAKTSTKFQSGITATSSSNQSKTKAIAQPAEARTPTAKTASSQSQSKKVNHLARHDALANDPEHAGVYSAFESLRKHPNAKKRDVFNNAKRRAREHADKALAADLEKNKNLDQEKTWRRHYTKHLEKHGIPYVQSKLNGNSPQKQVAAGTKTVKNALEKQIKPGEPTGSAQRASLSIPLSILVQEWV